MKSVNLENDGHEKKQVHNNQRDGMHRQSIARGRVSYEPSSLVGGCPFQAGAHGFTSFPERVADDKRWGKPELLADHYSQARLFWGSQSAPEQAHIVAAFRFELTRVQTPAVRVRMVSMLVNVHPELAARVAFGLGIEVPPAMALACDMPVAHYAPSPALSLLFRPGHLDGRRVTLLVADGVEGAEVRAAYAALLADGAVPRLVGSRLGSVAASGGTAMDVEISLEAAPSSLYDIVLVADGAGAVQHWMQDGHTLEFLRDQYRHGKPICLMGGAVALLEKAGIPAALPDGSTDPALVIGGDGDGAAQALTAFKGALTGPRAFGREAAGSAVVRPDEAPTTRVI